MTAAANIADNPIIEYHEATAAIASDVTNGRFKLLKWDRIQASYFPIEINLFQK